MPRITEWDRVKERYWKRLREFEGSRQLQSVIEFPHTIGLQPCRYEWERIQWFCWYRLPELHGEVTESWPGEHQTRAQAMYEAAVKQNPRDIAERVSEFIESARYELKRNGFIRL